MTNRQFTQLGFILTMFFIITSIISLIIFWGKLPPQSPLFYSLPWGEQQLADSKTLFLLPLISLLVLGFNFGFNKLIKEKGLLTTLAYWTATIVSFLSFFTLIKIIFLIT
jgi:hypothetical protein